MAKLLSADQVAEMIPGITRRTALRIIGEIGRVTIHHSAYCHADALERYISDRTTPTFYNVGERAYKERAYKMPNRRRA